MKQDEKCDPKLYDPTFKTTVDEVQGTIGNPGRLVEKTSDEEATIELNRSLILIGSDPAADIIVEDSKATDYIAEITHENSFYTLRRLENRSTVTVDNKPVEEHVLADGDEIQFADRTFLYRAPAQPNQPQES